MKCPQFAACPTCHEALSDRPAMPYYSAPNTPEDHLFILEESVRYCDLEQTAGRFVPLKSATRSAVNAFITDYKPLVAALTLAKGTHSREVSESQAAKAFLEESARDYIEVLKRRTRRKKHDVAVLVNHGLPENGDTPQMDSWAELKAVATALIAGDAASTATYGAMANPSAAELQTALTAAQAEHEDVGPADSVVQAAQLAIQDKATLAAFWVSEIRFDALDFARRETDSGQRRLLRKLGFKFKNNPGETPEDPADGVTPAPTPTPPPA